MSDDQTRDPEPSPGNLNGERIDEPNVNQVVVGVTYDEPGVNPSGGITVDGFVATLTITGGNGDEVRLVNWGDGSPVESYTLSDDGSQVAHHTYAEAGTYTVSGADSAGNVLDSQSVTIAETEPPEDGPFDPSVHTVDETKAHLAAHPEDMAAVLEAEQAGQNRSSLTSWIESHLAGTD